MMTKYISLEGLEGDPGLENSFLVTSNGAPGDLVAKLVSTSDSQLREVEIVAKDEADAYNGGSHPWSLEEGNDSTLLLFNHSQKTLYFNVNIGSGAVIWEKAYLLQPMETRKVSLRELIETQVQDDKKRVLAKDRTSGQLLWFVHALNAGHGRLLQSNSGTAMARNFSCPNGVVIGDAYFYNPGFSPTSLVAGQTQNTPNVQTDAFFPTYQGACSGQWAANGGTGLIYQWTSWNINAVSISGSNTMDYASLYGAGAGTAEVDVLVTDSHGCAVGAGGHTTVKPGLTSVSPAQGLIGNTVSVSLSGKGFGSSPSVSAGSGITVTINSKTDTNIGASFAISTSATSGNHSVTVTSGGQTSTAVNFYVQVPTKLVRTDYPGVPSGYGPLVVLTNGNVVNAGGQVLLTNQCGMYRNLVYSLQDQRAGDIDGTYTLVEMFSNYSSTFGGTVPPTQNLNMTPGGLLADIQYIGKTAPSCPGSNDHESFTQSLKVIIGTGTYPLSTVNSIQRGNYSSVAHADVTITTP